MSETGPGVRRVSDEAVFFFISDGSSSPSNSTWSPFQVPRPQPGFEALSPFHQHSIGDIKQHQPVLAVRLAELPDSLCQGTESAGQWLTG